MRNRLLRRLLALSPRDRVLELGCGNGKFLLWNRALVDWSVGVDPAPLFADAALRDLDLVRGDARLLPFPDASFSKLWSIDVLEHLDEADIARYLAEAYRVLVPGGRFFIFSNTRERGPFDVLVAGSRHLANWLARRGWADPRRDLLRKSDHLKVLETWDAVEAAVTAAGFEVRRVVYWNGVFQSFIDNVALRLAERLVVALRGRRGGSRGRAGDARAGRAGRRGAGGAGGAQPGARPAGAWRAGALAAARAHRPDVDRHRPLRPLPHGSLLRAAAEAEARRVKILYVSGAIALPGTSGGAIHVQEVAEGLARRGHRVHVVARRGRGALPAWAPGVTRTLLPWPDKLAALAYPTLARLVPRFRPDVIMERYYNFAGAGVLLAHRRGIPALLEVNAPMVDPPGSRKDRLDALLGRPLRRWAVRQARWSARLVTPLASTVPAPVPRAAIVLLPWGANVDRFCPAIRTDEAPALAALRALYGIPEDAVVAAFAGSFRAWHGAAAFVRAARGLLPAHPDLWFLAVGGGPELPAAQALAAGLPPAEARRIVFTGPQPHAEMPRLLALAAIGVAPFVPAAYPPLRHFGFYWSPLKVFEYMAMGLPVVAPAIAPLDTIVRDGKEGRLYPEGDEAALAAAIAALAAGAPARAAMGAAARARVVAHYSWAAHCAALEQVLEAMRCAS